MPDESAIDRISAITGLSRRTMQEIFEQVKANQKLLDECKGHDFSKPWEKRGEMIVKWQCTKCLGLVDPYAKRWYERGLTDGLRRG